MGYISTVSIALPRYRYSTADIESVVRSWLGDKTEEAALFTRFLTASRIEQRYFAIPLEELLAATSQKDRAKLFIKAGSELGLKVVRDALDRASLSAASCGALVSTSCSVPLIPALDTHICNALELPATLRRLPIYQYGCAGGAAGLALADELLRARKEENVLLLSVELCSLVYQRDDLARGNLLGSALFGDGAACCVITAKEGPLKLVDTSTFLLPETLHLMGYDILENGAHLRLDRELPQKLIETVPHITQTFLAKHLLSTKDIKWWLFHPGGAKILTALEQAFALKIQQSLWAWEVLQQYGNISSASILFVLSHFLAARPYASGDLLLMLGIGPGISIELLLFECV